MPTINKRLLLKLFVVVLLLGGGLFVIHHIQSDRTADALRWQAEHAAESGKIDKAILYMRQYLELRPEDHEAATKLAGMILQRGNGPKQLASALFLYERVLREAPQREDIRRLLVDLCLRLNRHGDAQIHVKALLDKSPTESPLWEKLAICQTTQNKLDDARTSFEKAIDNDPNNVRAYELLADLLIRQMNLDGEGRDWLDKMVRANPTRGEAYLVRARYWRSKEKHADSQRDLDRLLELDPENADGLLLSAEIQHAKGEVHKARAMLSDGMSLHVKDVRFYRTLSWLELTHGNLQAGITCLERGVRELPGALELLTPLGDLLVQQGEIARARTLLPKLEGQRNYGSQLKYLRGRLLMAEEKWAEATTLLEALRTEAVAMPRLASQVNWLLAQCQDRLGDADGQLESLKRVLAIDPGHLNARLKFGTMHLSASRTDEAIREYLIAARSPYAPLYARITLGRLYIAKARSSGTNEDWHTSAEYIEALRKKYPNTVDPILLAAEMNLYQHKHEAARKLLRGEAGRQVNDARIWSALAAVELDAVGLHRALDVLDEAQSILGDSVELRLARGRVWTNDWQPRKEDRIRALGRGVEELPEAEQLRLLSGLTDVCAAIGDREGVKLFQKQIAARLPKDLAVRQALFATAASTKDAALMAMLKTEINTLQKVGEETLAVAEGLAQSVNLTADDPKLATQERLARRILAAKPDRADAHFLLARCAEKTGDVRTASKHYDLAVEFERSNLAYLEGQLAFHLRSSNDGKQRLERLLTDPRLSWEGFRALLAGASTGLSDSEWAKCFSTVTPLLKSGSMLLWAAQMEQARGRIEAAITLAKRATALSPLLVDAWIIQVRSKPEEAATTLAAARRALDDRDYYLVYAECAKAVATRPSFDKPEQQRHYVQGQMKALLIRGQIKEAAEVLRAFSVDPQTKPTDIAWAKRNLAMLAASNGAAEERRNALTALKEWKPDEGAAIDDLRSRVAALAVAARHLYGAERKQVLLQAVAAMKLVTDSKEAQAKDWYHLGQFHLLAGDRAAQLASLKIATQKDESNLFYVVVYVEELLADGKFTEAASLTSRLLQATHDVRATSTAAKYYCLTDAPSRAREIVEHFIRSSDAGTPEGMVRTRQAAEMFDQLARLATTKGLPSAKILLNTAIEKYRYVLKTYPDSAAPMAALLAFGGSTPAAFDLLGSLKGSLPLKSLASAAMGVLRNGSATPRQFQVVRGWLDEALAVEPGNLTLRLSLAEFLALKQDYAGAEPIYRDALKAEPNNIVALNNLAWILSPRTEAADEAMKCVEHAIELSGPTGELLDTRARIHIARGSYDRAIEDLQQALHLSQTSLRYFHLAVAQFKQLKKDEAIRSFKEARALGIDARMIHPSDMPMFKVMASQME